MACEPSIEGISWIDSVSKQIFEESNINLKSYFPLQIQSEYDIKNLAVEAGRLGKADWTCEVKQLNYQPESDGEVV